MSTTPNTQNTNETDELLANTAQRAIRYVNDITNRKVSPTPEALAALSKFHEPFPVEPCNPRDVLALLDDAGSLATMATTGGRYFGYVNGATLPASLAANWLASSWDQNVALRAMSPVAGELEDVVLPWVCEALGLPLNCGGALVTGATMANFSALAAARCALLARAGWNVVDDGMFGAPPIEVVVGAEVHASVLKALSLAGFGTKRVTAVEVDGQGRLRADKLPPLNEGTLVCIQAGNVNTGSFDPAAEICARAREHGAWVHVDGAFGLWAAASPRYKHLLQGFDQASSWATDGHKWPNVNYDCGIVLVREVSALHNAMAMTAAYLEPGARREPMHYTPDSSRRARGVELWAALKSLGRSGLAELIDRTCAHAQRFALGLTEAGFKVLNEVVINQVLVSFGSPEVTREVIRRVQEDGTCWCGGTVWQGNTAMRISVSSWATTGEDIESSMAAIIRIARNCCV